MFVREYDHHLLEPCYTLASQPHWRNKIKGEAPHSPEETLALLSVNNPLRFRLMGYRYGEQARAYIKEALEKAQFRQYQSGRQGGVDAHERQTLRRMLLAMSGETGMAFCGYYFGAVICRCRSSRNELTIVVGLTVDAHAYRTIRFADVPGELRLRFQSKSPGRSKTSAVDFCLSDDSSDGHMSIRIREHWNIHQNESVYPWVIRDGHSIRNVVKTSDCRDILLHQNQLNASGKIVVPAREYSGVLFENWSIF